MKTTRRKLQIYPVAFAIAFLIATTGRAQLCPTPAAITSDVAGFSAPTEPSPSLANSSDPTLVGHSSTSIQPTQITSGAPEQIAAVRISESSPFPTPTVVAQKASLVSSQPRDDVVHKLLLAASQPALAEASLQPMFAD
jgi:hypothetical protein